MKIKLYQCGGEQSLSEYPLGLGYLKANCAADVEIVNDRRELTGCDLIGLSSSAWGLREAVDILESAKVPVAIGGPGTLWEGLGEYPFEHIVIGEGESSLASILDGSATGKVVRSELVVLDTLNYPHRGRCGRAVPILTSRGCPYSCAFCSARSFWGRIRYHSAEYFMGEVEHIIGMYPRADRLHILDDLFIANVPRFWRIHDLWMGKGCNRRLKLRAFVRSNLLTPEIATAMREMGFRRVRFGAESGSDRMLKLLNKGATVEDNRRAVDTARKAGLSISCSFMHGLPGETKEDREATRSFIKENKIKVEGWYRYQSFPGTRLWNGENPLKLDMRVR